MSYVRSILPPETEPLWARLGQAVEAQQITGKSLWNAISNKVDRQGKRG